MFLEGFINLSTRGPLLGSQGRTCALDREPSAIPSPFKTLTFHLFQTFDLLKMSYNFVSMVNNALQITQAKRFVFSKCICNSIREIFASIAPDLVDI